MKTLTETIIDKVDADVFSQSVLSAYVTGSVARRQALLKRAMAAGEIVSIRRGLYCLAQKFRRRPFDLFPVAQKIYGPSYISFESALSYHGWIPEATRSVSSACFGKAKEFSSSIGVFSFYRVPVKDFFEGVERRNDGALIARPFKALLDYIYCYKKSWTGSKAVIESLRVDAKLLNKVSQAEIGRYRMNYPQQRVQAFLTGMEREREH